MTEQFLLMVGQIVFLSVALCIVAYDLRQMRIPDILSVILVSLFVALCTIDAPEDFWARLGLSATVFTLGFIAFARRMMGGGDVKIMTALALFVPVSALAETALVFSATLFLGTVLVLVARRIFPSSESWAFLNTKRMPMGLPIGLAAVVLPVALA